MFSTTTAKIDEPDFGYVACGARAVMSLHAVLVPEPELPIVD